MKPVEGCVKKKKQRNSSSSKKRKELPRKAAKIRRTFPEDGVEKTELHFVLYKDPETKYNRENFLQEVADFFSEQAARLAEKQEVDLPSLQPGNSARSQKIVEKAEKKSACKYPSKEAAPPAEPGIILVKDVLNVKEQHHEQNCPRSKALRTSLPIIKRLIDKIRSMSDEKKRQKDLQAILKTAEQCYDDVQQCLKKGGPVGEQILDRIMRLNKMASSVLADSGGPEVVTIRTRTVISSNSISNVDATSDSGTAPPPVNHHRRR